MGHYLTGWATKGNFQKENAKHVWNFPYVGWPPPPPYHMVNLHLFYVFKISKFMSLKFWKISLPLKNTRVKMIIRIFTRKKILTSTLIHSFFLSNLTWLANSPKTLCFWAWFFIRVLGLVHSYIQLSSRCMYVYLISTFIHHLIL